MTTKDILKKTDIFASLDEDDLSLIEERFIEKKYKSGDYICNEGETGDQMYVIVSGEVEVLKKGEKDVEIEIAVLKAGEVAGVMSIFEQDVRSASLKAKGPVGLLILDRVTFSRLLSDNPPISQMFLRHLSKKLRAENFVVAKLMSGDVDNRMKVAVFDTKPYTRVSFLENNNNEFALRFFEPRLTLDTVSLVTGFGVVCVFVNDTVDERVIKQLRERGVGLIALRCAGYNNVDLEAAYKNGISVTRVPAYSPHAVAEHASTLLLSLNRKVHKAYNRVREGNFSLSGLVGFDLYGKTAGIVGVGRIGKCLAHILSGFGMNVLGYDRTPDKELTEKIGIRYVDMDELFSQSDVISLHAPLLPATRHMINAESIGKMKSGVILINTGRGALIDTVALTEGLKSGKIGAAGLDVYEEEEEVFFEDLSDRVITDDVLARLLSFSNVIVTSHQAFLTREALSGIARITLDNIIEYRQGKQLKELTNTVLPPSVVQQGKKI
ncbi:MAG: cyclic nucleotide-binding domain-containing protein [Spirochaetales bacterium]|nr:cyclic nucleotide-binding domain-containing protein [Spirochaetales bacterium]